VFFQQRIQLLPVDRHPAFFMPTPCAFSASIASRTTCPLLVNRCSAERSISNQFNIELGFYKAIQYFIKSHLCHFVSVENHEGVFNGYF
jgi:hypothetical protein